MPIRSWDTYVLNFFSKKSCGFVFVISHTHTIYCLLAVQYYHYNQRNTQVTSWGGMDVGNGMMFASNVVDGLVHRLGGKPLAHLLQDRSCPEGHAVVTPSGNDSELQQYYRYIVHTVPPFYNNIKDGNKDEDVGRISEQKRLNDMLLSDCYRNSLAAAVNTTIGSSSHQERKYSWWSAALDPFGNNRHQTPTSSDQVDERNRELRIACPLLGAGCRGFPNEAAIRIVVDALLDGQPTTEQYQEETNIDSSFSHVTIVFGIPSPEIQQQFHSIMEEKRATIT